MKRILYALFVAGCCLPASGQSFVVTDRSVSFVVTDRATQQPAATRVHYLVCETYCIHCPARKADFLGRGWPESNVLTNDECQSRFGFRVPKVPYEFEEPVEVVKTKTVTRSSAEIDAENHLRDVHGIDASGKSLAEMELIHDKAHGGSGYHFPGRPSLPVNQPASNCPGGVCPTSSRPTLFNRGGIFRRR